MKVTIKDVHEVAKQINTLRGFENVSYNTIGALHVYKDVCGIAIDMIMNSSGGVKRIAGGGLTKKEAYFYLKDLLDTLESEV